VAEVSRPGDAAEAEPVITLEEAGCTQPEPVAVCRGERPGAAPPLEAIWRTQRAREERERRTPAGGVLQRLGLAGRLIAPVVEEAGAGLLAPARRPRWAVNAKLRGRGRRVGRQPPLRRAARGGCGAGAQRNGK
jgi:hypothetical protein